MNFSQLIIGGGNRNWVLRRAMLWFLPPALLVLFVIYYLYIIERDAGLDTLATNEVRAVEISKAIINTELTSAKSDLLFMRAVTERMLYPLEQNGMSSETNLALDILTGHFKDLITTKQKYDQGRFLDITGQELIRVNLKQGRAVIVAKDRLQDKSTRYYFKDTMALGAGESYVSPFDLNVEYGDIELPLKPMLRLGAKVKDIAGTARGVVVLNFLGETFFDTIHSYTRAGPGRLTVVNPGGYWIHNHTDDREWGFMFGREGDRFQVDFPDAWPQIGTNDSGQIQTPGGLFTFTSIYPYTDTAVATGARHVPRFDAFWKIISVIPQSQLNESNTVLLQRWISVGATMLFLLALIAFLIAQAQSARQEVAKRMHRLETQESLGRLANSVAHEFNNLLVPIRALSEMVMHDQPKESSSRRRLEKVVEASLRAKTLIEGILVFSKEKPDDDATCNAKSCIADAMALIRDTLPSTIKLDENFAKAIPPVACSARQFRVILVNLLSNARDALEGHVGTITITLNTDQPSSEESDALDLPNDATYVHLTINDSGSGMSEKTLQQALDPFFTTKSVGEGHGLGLYQVHMLVNGAGGALSIDSAPNVGTAATVWLPLSTDHADLANT